MQPNGIYSFTSEEFTADCVEWCPIKYTDFVICATYLLYDKENQKKKGKIFCFEKQNNSLQSIPQTNVLVQECGIFDVKWNHKLWTIKDDELPILAQAGSNGTVVFYSIFKNSDNQYLFEKLDAFSCEHVNQSSCLSIDWNMKQKSDPQSNLLAISHANGHLSLLDVQSLQFQLRSSWKAHDYEAWITSFDYHNSSILYSGADDALLKMWDIRQPKNKASWQSNAHSAGVCSVQSNPQDVNIFVSGSYDESLLVWDRRALNEPLQSYELGGGVWKIKFHPTKKDVLAAACMHNGLHVVDTSKRSEEGGVLAHFTEHQSLAYGVDWDLSEPFSLQIASCSFYDCLFKYWQVV